jgi:hypothetical protein
LLAAEHFERTIGKISKSVEHSANLEAAR